MIRGIGGSLYALGKPYKFKEVPLEDCGDGWDWRAPKGLGYWLPEGLSFEVRNGEWRPAETVEVHHRLGRVGFTRCLSGLEVRASGTCRPSTLLAAGERWQIEVDAVVNNSTVLGSEAPTSRAKTLGVTATISGIISEQIDEGLAWLPTTTEGAFVGAGTVVCRSGQAQIEFDSEGVRHGNW